jgi:hypothetical protein
MDPSGRNYVLARVMLSSLVSYITVNFSRIVKLVLQRGFEHSMSTALPSASSNDIL